MSAIFQRGEPRPPKQLTITFIYEKLNTYVPRCAVGFQNDNSNLLSIKCRGIQDVCRGVTCTFVIHPRQKSYGVINLPLTEQLVNMHKPSSRRHVCRQRACICCITDNTNTKSEVINMLNDILLSSHQSTADLHVDRSLEISAIQWLRSWPVLKIRENLLHFEISIRTLWWDIHFIDRQAQCKTQAAQLADFNGTGIFPLSYEVISANTLEIICRWAREKF